MRFVCRTNSTTRFVYLIASSNNHLAFPEQSSYNQHSGVMSHVSEKRKIRFRCAVWDSSRSQWPRGLRRGSAAARLLGLRVRIPPGKWMSISCGCCQVYPLRRNDLSSRGVLPNVVCPACDREASTMRISWHTTSCCVTE